MFRFFLFQMVSSFLLTVPKRPPTGVDVLPRYYHIALFSYFSMKARDVGRMAEAATRGVP